MIDEPEDTKQRGLDFKGQVAFQLKMGGQPIIIMGVYLAAGSELRGASVDKLIQMGQLIQSIRTPWLVIGDFNAEPHELEEIGWPKLADGIIWAADGSDSPCILGKKRMTDYMVVSPSMHDQMY
eukprot:8918528-Pyramimonas_sp.AAC.1